MATSQLKSLSQLVDIPIQSHQDELYLIRLASLSLRELQEEPDRLDEQQSQLELDMKKNVYENNDIFISSQDCLKDIHKSLSNLSKDISDSYNILPSLQYTCKRFSDEATDLIKQHQKNKKTLRYHSQLLELLEMPQLIDTCVKNGLYDEALVLLAQCRKLTTIHVVKDTDIPDTPGYGAGRLIQKIWSEMKQISENEQQLIWKELEGELQLQRAITLIKLLNKINEYIRPTDCTDIELARFNEQRNSRKHFLKARSEYFAKKLNIYSKYDSGLYLKEYIDLCRELWMNTITQYITIFLNTESISTKQSTSSLASENNTLSPLSPSDIYSSMLEDTDINDADASSYDKDATQEVLYDLHEWCSKQFDMFIDTLNLYMYKITNGTTMLQVMKQGLYLCDSITNIHCDYRSILVTTYSKAIQTLMKKFWTVCTNEFNDSVTTQSFWSKPLYTSNIYKLRDPYTYFKYYVNSSDYYKLIPPSYLMDIPCLSKLFNDFIGSFNELRYCAIKGKGQYICQSMTTHCLQLCTSLLTAKNMLKSIIVPRSISEGYISIQEHFNIICLQLYCTIFPLLNFYIQNIFHIHSSFIDIDCLYDFYIQNDLCVLPDHLNPLTYVLPTYPDVQNVNNSNTQQTQTNNTPLNTQLEITNNDVETNSEIKSE